MSFENLLLDRDGPVAIVTINRPRVLNALNAQTIDELRRAMLELQRDAQVRAIVLTGAGEKSFVAGADINELAVQTPTAGREHALRGQHVLAAARRRLNGRSEEHTSELQSLRQLVCRLLLEKKKRSRNLRDMPRMRQ